MNSMSYFNLIVNINKKRDSLLNQFKYQEIYIDTNHISYYLILYQNQHKPRCTSKR